MTMNRLNLPPYDFKIKKEEGNTLIFDLIRRKYVVLTPEEWVRQHFVNYLVSSLNYPKSLFKVESGLRFNRMQKRSDILIHNRQGRAWMLVECKSPDIKLTQKAFNQIAVYNMTIGAKYLAVTNGMMHYCCEAGAESRAPIFLDEFPAFGIGE
jgi:predicted type IV restriction endonuclease